jgi:hypothetical protein
MPVLCTDADGVRHIVGSSSFRKYVLCTGQGCPQFVAFLLISVFGWRALLSRWSLRMSATDCVCLQECLGALA